MVSNLRQKLNMYENFQYFLYVYLYAPYNGNHYNYRHVQHTEIQPFYMACNTNCNVNLYNPYVYSLLLFII